MMAESIKLPAGFRFSPFDEELISLYLKPKVLGQKLPCNIVEERQLYGPNANPWQVFDPENHSWILSEVTPGRFEKVTYIFVNLTKMGVQRKYKLGRVHTIKKAGCGTWGGKTSRSEIKNCNGDVIGEKRLLVYEINEVCDLDLSKVGYWKMHEYNLHGINEDISNPGNIVLCKITFDCSKSPAMKLYSNIDHDHPVKSSSNVESVSSPLTIYSSTVDRNQGVMGNYEEAIMTQASRDDSIVSDSYRDEGKETYNGTDIVKICDGSSHIKENILKNVTLPSEQLDTGYLKHASSDFYWSRKYDNDYKKIKKEGGREDSNFGMTKAKPEDTDFCWRGKYDNDYKKIKKEGIREDSNFGTTEVKPVSSDFHWPAKYENDYKIIKKEGGREDSNFGMTEVKPKPVSSDSFWPPKYDNNYQKIKKEASGREYSGFGTTEFSSYLKAKKEQAVKDTTTNLGKRKVKVETSSTMTKKLSPFTVIID